MSLLSLYRDGRSSFYIRYTPYLLFTYDTLFPVTTEFIYSVSPPFLRSLVEKNFRMVLATVSSFTVNPEIFTCP